MLPGIYAATGLRLLALVRDTDDPGVREIGIAVGAVAAGSSSLAPAVMRGVEAITGDANYARFFSQVATAVAAGYGRAVMIRSAYPAEDAEPRIRTRRRRMTATLAVMGVLFVRDRATAVELQRPTERLFTPRTAVYWLVFAGFMVEATGEVARLAFRSSRLSPQRSVRIGLRAVSGGTALLTAFYAHYGIGTAGRTISRRFPPPLRGIPAQALTQAGALTIAAGASLPGAMVRWGRLRSGVRDTRTGVALAPVWRRFRRDAPNVTLTVGAIRSPELRLFRRVVETLDGLDRLASRRDPTGRVPAAAEAVGRSHGLDTEDRAALARAALIQHAADYPTKTLHRRPGDDRGTDPAAAARPRRADFRDEARRLLRTKAYLEKSTLPHLVVQTVRAGEELDERTLL
jgi:hypothetical protein